jgi:hypothetical protein
MKTLGIALGIVGVALLTLGLFSDSGAHSLLHAESSLAFPRQTFTLCGAFSCILSFFIWRSRHRRQ